ncbi:LysR family substrate-binding domain-containing protein [Microbacterium sp. 179-I 3D4 NHS]|uniref:LysR family substrate-binding domain-containing protein n=1 Tax=Microbacterium sp. 179-I 3D4 NHS TaxID=3142381 RepID=UPI00399FC1E0
MATHGRRPARRPVAKRSAAPPKKSGRAPREKVVFDAPAPAPAPEEARTFRLGAVPGATPGKWIDAWKQRMPHVPLELVPLAVTDQARAVRDVDAALVRLPLDDPALHLIPLYDEVPVVVAPMDSHLHAAEELSAADLVGETLLPLADDALPAHALPGTLAPRFGALSTQDAIATVASGVGIVVVPMSLARLHRRKDVDQRPLRDGPISTVALAWMRERTTPDVETFVGIVRGRTANSSR